MTPPLTPVPRYEVVREHPATGRSQLVAWDILTWQDAVHDAERANARTQENGGQTMTQGGHLESGWTYSARLDGRTVTCYADTLPALGALNGAPKNGTALRVCLCGEGFPHSPDKHGAPGERGRRATRRGRAAQ